MDVSFSLPPISDAISDLAASFVANGFSLLESWASPQGAPCKPCFDEEFDCGYRSVSSGSAASLGAVRRNFMSPSPAALPARFLKKSAA